MQKYAMLGGVLSIVSGAFSIFSAIACVIAIIMFTFIPFDGNQMPNEAVIIIAIVYSVIGFFLLLLGILSIVGGAFCIKKKHWPLALSGSIAATIVFLPCGIPALIFTTLAKPEFDIANTPASLNG
jgi:hypothetical protein